MKSKKGYADLQEHIRALNEAGLLVTIDQPVNKDTEMHPLVRWQFRGGIAEADARGQHTAPKRLVMVGFEMSDATNQGLSKDVWTALLGTLGHRRDLDDFIGLDQRVVAAGAE